MKPFGQLLAATATLGVLFCHLASAQEDPSTTNTQTTPSSASGQASAPTNGGEGWHFDLSPYLWFAGAHGNVGPLGDEASIHATPGDLLSHFDIGVMGAAEARYNRLLNGDLLWVRISDSHAVPFAGLDAISADARAGELVWTSKLGYRLMDYKKLKADANLGVRFWHLEQTPNFNPSLLGLSFNGSQNWADIVIGGRVQLPMGKKAEINLLGDVGGWNATAKLDYQFAAVLGYKVGTNWTLLAGYRYLYVDYLSRNSSVFNMITSGALLGVAYRLK